MRYRFYSIKWDTDGESHELPSETVIEINDPEFNPETEGADALSDKFGFCVFEFEYQQL